MGNAGIYVFDSECSLLETSKLRAQDEGKKVSSTRMHHHYVEWVLRNEAEQMGMLAETYESACILVHVSPGSTKPCAVDQPRWSGGANHLLVDMSDNGRGSRPIVAGSYAMEAASNMQTCFYRSGFDISVPLHSKKAFNNLADVAAWDRNFFLTTKGSLYLSRHGSGERMSLVPLQDEANGVIMSLHCFELHNEHLLPENVEYCRALSDRYGDHSYESLMNSTFGLVPAGRSPGTFRLGEVMSAGSIPVFVGWDLVLPFKELIDWSSFSFAFAPDQVGPQMVRTLRAVPRAELEQMQRKSLKAHRKIFGVDKGIFVPSARIMLKILQRRLGHRMAR
ncbi:Glycosyltransferase, family GT47 [Ectocarpus siliculosus]|uniref:Glycosyltransferase, family GT47 n=1 Tax=Ectocarpus siliculosus TaxID=2880 RepID=D7G4H1_ECTSI|nr:Glycosyltransferase, family GT47 [Ectocarpus siliculosus]|eukprot:CBJ48874.1 Glycosyltransferase, family GT47 [Ectocarpus siliculosus]